MNTTWNTLRIDAERFRQYFEAISQIGATPEGGVHRPALGEAHREARQWFVQKIEQAGLEVRIDAAGNHSAFLNCGQADAKTLLIGSHLDSVPRGGRFDGVLGVLAGFEVLHTLKEAGVPLAVNVEVIDCTDEEGVYIPLLGSRALTGKLRAEHFETPRAGREAFTTALEEAGFTRDGILTALRDLTTLAGYLELHIEQGARLQNAHTSLGIVTSIVGICSYRLTFTGRANHAGTTPMQTRRDAALGASAFTLAARELVINQYPDCVVNVGAMRFAPGAFNIVPEQATLSLEFRAPDSKTLEEVETALLECARREATRFELEVAAEFVGKVPPAPMDSAVQAAYTDACETSGISAMSMLSGAGHDAQSFADVCPTGMIFVPSVEGISHSPYEFTEWEDCVNGANVLLQAVLRLASA